MAIHKDTSPVRKALGKTVRKAPTSRANTLKQLEGAYDRLFKTRDGKLVLADLNNRFYDNEISESDTTRQIGKRDVLLFINKRVTP